MSFHAPTRFIITPAIQRTQYLPPISCLSATPSPVFPRCILLIRRHPLDFPFCPWPCSHIPSLSSRSSFSGLLVADCAIRIGRDKDPMADSDNESGGGNGGNANSDFSTKEQDRFLPIANVSRIMKKALPANAKISKDAKETVQECVSEFISFVTGEASDKCQREKRKTINGDDLLWAMTTLGFEDYVEPLKIYLQKYREMEGDKTSFGRHGEKDGGSSGGSGVVGFNGADGMYGGMTIGHHQGQVYGSGGFNPGNGGGGGSNMRSR